MTTDRETLLAVKSLIDAQLAPSSEPVQPTPTDPQPTPPAPLPPSADVDGVFTWENVGEVKHVRLEAGRVYCYQNTVPAGALISYQIIPVTSPERSPDYVHDLKIWQSATPRGESVAGYEGPWLTAGLMPTPQASFPAGPAFFNVSVSDSGEFGLKQIHS